MVTGSTVSSFQGDPRATHDIDIVIELKQTDLALLFKAFPQPEYYWDRNYAEAAVETKQMFDLMSVAEGDKVDFFLLTPDAYDQVRFARRTKISVFEFVIDVSSPEDTILYKLHWAKLSGSSEKQLYDALRVYEVQYDILDMPHIEKWVLELGVEALWERLKSEAFKIPRLP